jgi:hypothetical protein
MTSDDGRGTGLDEADWQSDERRHGLGHGPGGQQPDDGISGDDRTRDQLELLLAREIDRDVNEAPLDLEPLVARLARQTMGVVVERLMKDADDEEPAVGSRRGLGKLLEQMDLATVGRAGPIELRGAR